MLRLKRNYSLFVKVQGRYKRLTPIAVAPKARAVRVFQNALLAGYIRGFRVCLRPAEPQEYTEDYADIRREVLGV